MRVARWVGAATIRTEDAPVPDPRPDEALVRVAWTGLCGSDLEEYRHGPVVARPGVVLGHEIVGTVSRPASDGSGPAAGSRVVVDVVTGCGRCFWCERHEEGLCPDLVVTGQHVDGGLAEYVVGRAARLIVVPESLPLRHAVLAEPAAVAVRAARKVGAMLGRGAVVVGGGTVGLLVGQVLRHAGADRVTILEPSPARRMVAARLGLDAEWEPDEKARARTVADRFPQRGVDVVLECSGTGGAAREAVRLVRPGGTAVLLGVPAADEPFDGLDLVVKEKTVVGSAAHMWDDDVAVAVGLLASGAIEVEPLISQIVALEDAPQAFELLAGADAGIIKLLVRCDSDAS